MRDSWIKVSWRSNDSARSISSNSENLLLSGIADVSSCCSVGLLSGAVDETKAGEVGWVDTEGGGRKCVRGNLGGYVKLRPLVRGRIRTRPGELQMNRVVMILVQRAAN